jgi:prophage regulatory protein
MNKVLQLPLPLSSITGDRILRLPQVKERTGMSRSFIYAAEDFPTSIRLGDRAVGWLESEISVWIESRKAMRQQEAA